MGEFIALMLVFNPTQQIETRTWLPILREAQETYDQFAFYEIPVMNEFKPAQQQVVFSTMQRSILAEQRQHTVIPIFLNKQAFRRRLQIATERSLNVILLDREGFVHWRAEGFANLLKQAQFRRALANLVPQTASSDRE
jgi:hypothetical protein